jgi:sulfite exporter TauE/SafE
MIDSELEELPNVEKVTASLQKHQVTVTGDFGDKSPEQIAEELSIPLARHGYNLTVEKQAAKKNWSEFIYAVPIAAAFAVLFVLLQKSGVVNLVNASEMSYGTAFLIGVIASVSTCMAVVGGLILSMSASFAKSGDTTKPQILFHIGRIVSFFILGGIIGTIGSAFALNRTGTFALSLIIGLVMLMLGLNLLELFRFTKKLQPSMPKFISKHVLGISKFNHRFTPVLVGIATFFLPCGFTQSMQIYTLSTGNFVTGGLTMLAFALGTLPVLALISFSSFNIKNSSKSGIFFKTAGLIVILFALFNIISSFVAIGWIKPVFNF